jgi:hypothetical protein
MTRNAKNISKLEPFVKVQFEPPNELKMMEKNLKMMGDDLDMMEDDLDMQEDDLKIMDDVHKC